MKVLFYLLLFVLFIGLLYIIGFIRNKKMKKNVETIKEGQLKYPPYVIDKKKFIEECKNGLMYSIIRINNTIYEIETQPGDNSFNDYDNFTCYVNSNEIKGLDNFLNYKFDGNKSFNDLEKIEFLEINNNDPKKHLVDRII